MYYREIWQCKSNKGLLLHGCRYFFRKEIHQDANDEHGDSKPTITHETQTMVSIGVYTHNRMEPATKSGTSCFAKLSLNCRETHMCEHQNLVCVLSMVYTL